MDQKFLLEISITGATLTGTEIGRELGRLGRRLQTQQAERWYREHDQISTSDGRAVGTWRLVSAEQTPFVADLTEDERRAIAKMCLKRAEAIEQFITPSAKLWPRQYERIQRWREISHHFDPATDPTPADPSGVA